MIRLLAVMFGQARTWWQRQMGLREADAARTWPRPGDVWLDRRERRWTVICMTAGHVRVRMESDDVDRTLPWYTWDQLTRRARLISRGEA